MKILFLAFTAVSLLVAGALRVCDFLLFFNESSGFFDNNAVLSYMGIAFTLLLSLVLYFLLRKKLSATCEYKGKKNVVMAALSLICAAGFFFSAFEIFSEYSYIQSNNITEATAMGISLRLPLLIFTALTGVYLLIAAFDFFKDGKIFEKYAALPLVPAVWSLFFTLYLFMHHSVTPLQSENMFLILPAVSGAYTVLQYAFFVSKISEKKIRKLTVSATLFSSLALSFSLSNLIKGAFGIYTKGEVPFYVNALMLVMGAFILGFILTMDYAEGKAEEKPENKGKHFKK